jgi:hypothetical protein
MWLPDNIVENILIINGASKSYLQKELMLSMVDLIQAPSTGKYYIVVQVMYAIFSLLHYITCY